MKCVTLLLAFVSLSNSRYTDDGRAATEEKLKITDTFPTGKCQLTVQEGDLVGWKSYGYLLDGRVFDVGTYEGKIGNNEMIKGVDQGLRGLCQGDERSMRIHSDWAYGEEGRKGIDWTVPANSTVIYDIQIVSIERSVQKRRGLQMNQLLKFDDLNIVDDCGMKVQGGDKIYWRYIGTFTNGTGFDTGDFRANIDNGDVIRGVNEGMKGLCVGGKRVMMMHHSYAYGDRKRGNIPPYSDLVFNVHLKSLDRPGVGWEDLDTKQRKASVSKDEPVKITDIQITGNCDVKVSEGNLVTYKRYGYLLNGKIFDETTVETKIGDGQTVPGLEMGLVGLCVNDNRSITIHPDLAYGSKGLPGKVPSNATVIYDVHIILITRVNEGPTGDDEVEIEEHTGLKPNQKLKIEVLKTITDCGNKTQTEDTISWNYIGTFLNGTEFAKGTFKAKLGSYQVIRGVDRGMRGMCIGEKRKLTVHSDWAYGDEGRPGSIPPKTTLVFENELTEIERPAVDDSKAEL